MIKFAAYERLSEVFDLYDRYQFRDDKNHQWLQRACFWILSKIGSYAQSEEVKYEYHTIDTQDFLKQLDEQYHILKSKYNTLPSKVLVGANVYVEITGNPRTREMIDFRANYYRETGAAFVDRSTPLWPAPTVMGLDIVVVPWMEGVLLMP